MVLYQASHFDINVCGSKTKAQPVVGAGGAFILIKAPASATHFTHFSGLKIPEQIRQSGTEAAVAAKP